MYVLGLVNINKSRVLGEVASRHHVDMYTGTQVAKYCTGIPILGSKPVPPSKCRDRTVN
jgi:hypothetical protein